MCASCILKINTKMILAFVMKTLIAADQLKVVTLVKELQNILVENMKELSTIRLKANIKSEI